MKKNYITTPIYYVHDELHIGHAYTTILADVLNRFHNLIGHESFMLTGSDEHGQKVQEAAEKRGVSPIEHVDEYVLNFTKLWEKLNINYDDFIRTTDSRHTTKVKEMLTQLWKKEEIYLDEYEGLYSVSEERFVTEKEIDEGGFKNIIKLKEKNYFFKMSKYQDELIEHINQNPKFICPESRKNEILGFLSKPLNDLCISRPKSRLNWGIELPFDSNYVTYVWFDALMNYITAIGWNSNEKKFNGLEEFINNKNLFPDDVGTLYEFIAKFKYKSLFRNQENIKFVQDALFGATNEPLGTSYRSRLTKKELVYAGKTGTSQVRRFTELQRELEIKNEDLPYEQRDHALFVAFAPYKEPRYAISVLVEHGGSGSKSAAPIAKQVIKKVLEKHSLRESHRTFGETA